MPEYNPKYPKPKAAANARNPAPQGNNVAAEKQKIIDKLYAENAVLKAKVECLEKEVQRQAVEILPLKKEMPTALERAEKDYKKHIDFLTLCLDKMQEKWIACSDAHKANQGIIRKLDDENEALRTGDVSGLAKEIEALNELLESITTQAEEKRGQWNEKVDWFNEQTREQRNLAEARDQLIAHLKDENKLLRDGSQLKDARIVGLEAQVETLEGEKKILEEKKKERQKIAISSELGEQKKRALEREKKRKEKLLRRTKEDEEHKAAEKESASKIREIEEQLAELNVGDEV